MKQDTLVSVVIPVYNSEAYIRETLSSIIAQDCKNIEIIIVDDASTDSSMEIAKTMLKNSGRTFRIIYHPKNLGISAARNTGLASAKGRYIWFCDSDDIACENFISRLLAEAEEKNADAVFCGIKQYDESEGRLIDDPVGFIPDSLSAEDYLNAWACRKLNLWSVWNFLFKRELITKNGLHFYNDCKMAEDTEFLLKTLACAEKISCADEMLYTYITHSAKLRYGRKNPEMLRHMMLSRLRAGRFLLRHMHSKRVRQYFLSCYLPDAVIKRFTGCAAANDPELYAKLKRTLKHKTMRKILLSTARFIFAVPEIFFKSLMLLYAPDIYYLLRKE